MFLISYQGQTAKNVSETWFHYFKPVKKLQTTYDKLNTVKRSVVAERTTHKVLFSMVWYIAVQIHAPKGKEVASRAVLPRSYTKNAQEI